MDGRPSEVENHKKESKQESVLGDLAKPLV
jgi:hypothetical protein